MVDLIEPINPDASKTDYFDWTDFCWKEYVKTEPLEISLSFIDECESSDELEILKKSIESRLKEEDWVVED